MRERLIELLESVNILPSERVVNRLLAHGIIIPRCKVGDTIYRIRPRSNEIISWVIVEIIVTEDEIAYIDDSDNLIKDEDIGKTVFLTKAEAKERMCHEQG